MNITSSPLRNKLPCRTSVGSGWRGRCLRAAGSGTRAILIPAVFWWRCPMSNAGFKINSTRLDQLNAYIDSRY